LVISQVFAGHEGAVTCGLFSPDGRTVITGGADATVRLWAPKKGTCKHVFSGHGFHEAPVTCLSPHPLFDASGAATDDKAGGGAGAEYSLVLSGGEDGFAKLMHVGNKRVVASFDHSSSGQGGVGEEAFSVEAVGISKVHPWAATAGVDGTCKIWDVPTQRLRHTLDHPRSGAVTKVAWHPSGPCLLTASADGCVRLWDARQATVAATLGGHRDMVVDLAACFADSSAPAGSAAALDLLVTSSDDRTGKVFALPPLPP